jgi:hypothetical protein
LHDAITSEKAGTPAVGVMTSKFVSAAELMAQVLGMPGYQFSVIEHPVSSASDSELEARAQQALNAIDDLILSQT